MMIEKFASEIINWAMHAKNHEQKKKADSEQSEKLIGFDCLNIFFFFFASRKLKFKMQ